MDKQSQRRLVTRKRFNTSIDIELFEQLDKLSERTLIPKSKLFDKAIELVLEEYKDK
ncbi:MAG: ribbon-helix-helix domain-containing protein [Clostridium sp.]